MKRLALIAVLPLALAVSGCKWFKSPSKENLEPPTELVEFSATASVSKLWSRNLGEGTGLAGTRLTPAYSNGKVYASDIEGGVYALNADSGAELWHVEWKDLETGSSPTVAEGVVAVGTLDGEVIALDADTGAERWRAAVSSEVVAAPAIGNGVVVARSYDGRLFGLNLTDGTRRWVFDRGVPLLSLRGNGPPLIAGDAVFVGYDNGKIAALGLQDGTLRWEQALSETQGRTELERMNDVDGTLHVSTTGGELYAVNFNGQIGALAIDSGRLLWSREMSSYAGVALAGDKLFVADANGIVWSVDARSGSSLWKQEGLAHRWLGSPEVVDNYVVIGDLEGFVHWLDAETGAFAARQRVGDKGIRSAPLVVGNTVYVSGAEGDIAAFRVGGKG